MARRLARSGIRHARGFSTNVGNFVLTKTERAYAAAVNRQLRKRGIRGKRYVIETARNGAGEAPDLQVCNPPHARIGRKPKLVFDGALDGYLWVKHPGESDGPCHGGPASGEWWPEGALRLLGLA
jgi:endoglucanase